MTDLPLPWPWVPGEHAPGSFEERVQQNFEAIQTGAATSSSLRVRTYPATVIASTESRTNTAYGTLTTPDQVTGVVLPANSLIRVRYWATWQESVSGAARAALFIGANQLKVAFNSQANPVTEAAATGGGTAARDTPLFSVPWGLASSNVTAAYAGDVTTGQAVGFVRDTASSVYSEINGTNKVDGSGTGAENFFTGAGVDIFGAADTYTISVQFKASSGSVTAKNRRLWVEVHNYS